jgi:transposase
MDLPDARSLPPESLELLRKIAVRAVIELGMTNKEAAQVVGVGANAVGKWCAAYRAQGEEGLDVQPQGRPEGTGRSLSPDEEAEVKAILTEATPEDYDIPLPRWTRKAVRELIRKLYDEELTLQGVGKYLARWNMTPQKPARHAQEQDPDEVREFQEETLPNTIRKAEKEGGQLHFADETGARISDQIGAAYAPKGHTPTEDVPENRARQNVISNVTPEGEMLFWLFPGNMNAETFIEYLEYLLGWSRRKVFLFVDRHPSHTAAKVDHWLEEHSDQIEIAWLPRYSPEYNPDEFLNNDLKQNLKTKPLPDTSEGFRETIRGILEEIASMRERVKGYFRKANLEMTYT